jgi:uncharacterized protein
MTIMEKLSNDLVAAMKARDGDRVSALRMTKTAIENAVIEARGSGKSFEEDDELQVVRRQAKQLRESMAEYRDAGRDDLADSSATELAIVQEYLPATMNRDAIRAVVLAAKENTGATELGALMGAAMSELKGKADGNEVRSVVQEMLGE